MVIASTTSIQSWVGNKNCEAARSAWMIPSSSRKTPRVTRGGDSSMQAPRLASSKSSGPDSGVPGWLSRYWDPLTARSTDSSSATPALSTRSRAANSCSVCDLTCSRCAVQYNATRILHQKVLATQMKDLCPAMEAILKNITCKRCDEARSALGGARVIHPFWLYSRTSSTGSDFWRSLPNWRWLVVFLALVPTIQSATAVPIQNLCASGSSGVLLLSPQESTTLLLEAQNDTAQPCRVKIIAPDTHSISLLIVRRQTERVNFVLPEPKCPFIVSMPFIDDVAEEALKMSLNLCSESAMKTVEDRAEALPPVVTLEWMPTVNSTEEILAAQVVVAAVGRGTTICSKPDQFRCSKPTYCVAEGLVCDGHPNCPYDGSDEGEALCATGGSFEKSMPVPDHSSHIPGWEIIASEIIKRLSSKELRKPDQVLHTDKPPVLQDDGGPGADGAETLPDVLNHYGPWGYLMLGMLICGTVLMFCGLWECCCRKPKAPATSSAGPTLLIINQGAQETDTPPTPGPPRYEDLDQPPSYLTLFPSSKYIPPDITATNTLPIMNPIVESLSNSSSSPVTAEAAQLRGCTANQEVFTIDLPNSNCSRLTNGVAK